MNTPILAQDVRPEPGAISRSCLLALDLGTTTGWAIRGHDGLITSGTVSFRPGRFDGGGMRYLRFTNWLAELNRLSGPLASIWFEEVRRHAATDAAHVYGGMMATLTAWAELRGIPYQGVPVGTIKRHATGKGNADKAAMIAAVRARGFGPVDDNEADAIAILLWAIETNAESRMSIRLGRAGFGVQRRSALTRALAVSRRFVIRATMATFAGFPASRRAAYFLLRSGLKRMATEAGM
jgi:hypothetical protein